MKEKWLLIDGHSILHRAFYGIPMLTSPDGLHTNAVYGFLNILFKVMEEENPQYLTVAFDRSAPTFRHEIYEAYKGTRSAMPDELREQIPLMREVLSAMHIPVCEMDGFEADDLLGTLAHRVEADGYAATILSGDRDLLQLATDTIKIRIPKTSKGRTEVFEYFEADVLREYGVTPREFIDLKALMGDASDNIPGLPGVGIKTATKIIQQYHSIEEAHAHTEEIRPKKAMEAMRDQFALAELSKTLATISLDAPVSYEAKEARADAIFTEEARELFAKLGFRNMLARFGDAAPQADLPEIRISADADAMEETVRKVCRDGNCGIAALVDPACLYGFAVATDASVDFFRSGPETEARFVDALRDLAGTAGIAVYDLKPILRCVGDVREAGLFDVCIAAYLLDPLRADYPYDLIASEYAKITLPSAPELFGGKKVPPAGEMDPEPAARMTAYAALAARRSAETLAQRLADSGMRSLFDEIEMPLVYTLANMERAGIRIDADALAIYAEELAGRIEGLTEQIYAAAGEEFNINSPKQLGEILFEKMQIPGGKKTKTGYSTAADVLEKLAPDVPFVADVLTYRQLTKLKSTYADVLGGFADEDGRIRSHFNQTITATGRISSNEPNLQNIPVRMEIGRAIRKVFVPAEGCVFIDADYSQIELRVLAALSGDEKLIEAYRAEKDIHAITASQVFHVPFEEVTPLQRRNAKAVNFGIVYGISSFGLSQDLSVSRAEAAEYIAHYFETYPSIKAYLDGLVASAKETGYSLTHYGRRRPVPELTSSNFMQRSFGERVAMNAPIQGTAADIIKIAMNRVDRRLAAEYPQAHLILQVHDELLIECPADIQDAVCDLLVAEMTQAADLAVALAVDVHIGSNWYEAK